MMKDRLLPLGVVGGRFGVGRRTIYRWIQSGDIFDTSKIKKLPGGMRILESEVARAIENLPSIEV